VQSIALFWHSLNNKKGVPMNLNNISSLRCPYCSSELEVESVMLQNAEDIVAGCLKCKCSTYPILEGILNLNLGPFNNYIVQLIKSGRLNDALNISLWKYNYFIHTFIVPLFPSKILNNFLLIILNKASMFKCKKYFKNETFCSSLGKGNWDLYLKHRFSAESFWPIYSLIPLLKERKVVLNICCGAGHDSYLISKNNYPEQLFCIDRTFSNLYYVKKYFSKDSQLICMDINYPLPFKDGIFDAIFMSDAFQYIDSRSQLAKEMERSINQDGIIILSHVHNALAQNFSPGKPLSPLDWARLFKSVNIKIVPEGKLIDSFLKENSLDLTIDYPIEELNSSNNLAFIGSYSSKYQKIFNNLNKEFLMQRSNLIINPIFRTQESENKIELIAEFPSEFYKREYPLTAEYLDKIYTLDKTFIDNIKHGDFDSNPQLIEKLMQSFVLIDVPKGYS
jgi:SAM-dependent methyltransferase